MNKLILGLFLTSWVFIAHASEKLELPRPERFSLKNSANVITIKDDLPITVITISFGFGQLYENSSNAGIGNCLASMLSHSGSKNYPLGKLFDTVENMGGTLSINSSWDRFSFTIQVLDRFTEEAFKILGDLIANPNFDESSWQTSLKINADNIRRQSDNASNIAFVKLREKIFMGEGYGASPVPEKILNYKIEDVKSIWDKYFNSGNMIIGISSPRNVAELKAFCEKNFMGVKSGVRQVYSVDRDKIIKNINQNKDTIFFSERNIPQAVVTAGTLGQNKNYSGNLDLAIMNYILGGSSFSSRLMTQIRVERGLAYAVQSVYRSRAHTGVFLAYTQVAPNSVVEVLGIFDNNFKEMAENKIEEDKLLWSQTSIINSDVFKFDTPLSILSQYLSLEYYNLPQNYFEEYLKNIKSISAESIKNYSFDLFRHGLIKLIVGPSSLREELEKKYKVELIN